MRLAGSRGMSVISYGSIVIARCTQCLSTFNEHFPHWTVIVVIVGLLDFQTMVMSAESCSEEEYKYIFCG